MISCEAALIYTMVIVSAADRNMTDREMSAIGEIVRHLPAFREYDVSLLPETARSCAEMLNAESGMEAVLDIILRSVPTELRETAYALAIEIAAADGSASQEELRLLEMLRHQLNIDRLIAAGIERGARARYARL
ncbi:MAG: tellurite resistance TerB family protein [Alphaproteobacteria bacterium]